MYINISILQIGNLRCGGIKKFIQKFIQLIIGKVRTQIQNFFFNSKMSCTKLSMMKIRGIVEAKYSFFPGTGEFLFPVFQKKRKVQMPFLHLLYFKVFSSKQSLCLSGIFWSGIFCHPLEAGAEGGTSHMTYEYSEKHNQQLQGPVTDNNCD